MLIRILATSAIAAAAVCWAAPQAQAATPPPTPLGFLKVQKYSNIGGTAVADLTGNPKYPNSPDVVVYPTYLEYPQSDPPDINTVPPGDVENNYGIKVSGYFYPPETRAYVFTISADDNAQFWLSTDADPANAVRIAAEPEWNNPRDYAIVDRRPNGENKSAPINLTKAVPYYFEGFMKEGGGGDNFSVTIDDPESGAALPIDGKYLSPYDLATAPALLASPQDASVIAGFAATFSIGLDIPPGFTLNGIRWQKNNADIPGETGTTLNLVTASADDGAKIKAIVDTSGGVLTSSEATLTVATLANEFAPGVVKFEAYHDIAGTSVDLLLSDAKYPASPDNVRLLSGIDTPNGYQDNYGGRVTGFIIPPTSGKYRFFIRSDDASQFFLSVNETAPDPNTVSPICQETGCCAAFQEVGADGTLPEETSELVDLVAGQKYAFLALVKEGGGGDFLQVAARKDGDATPAGSLTPLNGSWLGSNAKPNKGTPEITTQPQGIPQLLQGRSATLTVAANVVPASYGFPALYQWNRNNSPIPDATGAVYTISSATENDGGTYTVTVSAPSGASVTSDPAVVTYAADTFAPKIASVTASSVSTLIVSFDEALDAVAAAVAANYSLSDGVAVTSATASGGSVLLSTGNLTVGKAYVLTVSNVKDLYGNVIAPGTVKAFTANVVTYSDVILADGPVLFYQFEETSGQKTANLGTAGAAADGLWMSGGGPDDSTPVAASSGVGPRPGQFLGFSPDNKSGKFTGPTGLEWVDAQQQLLNNLPQFSLEYWVKPENRVTDPTSFGNRIGIVGQNDAVEYGFINPNTIQIWTPGGGSLDTTYSFPDAEWHHVATIADGTSIKNYFDGVFINQVTQSTASYGSSTFNVHVGGGGAFDATGNHFTGEIDAVAIFAKAIPADRVAAHFKAGKEGGSVAVPVEPEVDGIAHSGGNVTITYSGTLQSSETVGGPYTDVAGAPAGENQTYSTATSTSAQYFRTRD